MERAVKNSNQELISLLLSKNLDDGSVNAGLPSRFCIALCYSLSDVGTAGLAQDT